MRPVQGRRRQYLDECNGLDLARHDAAQRPRRDRDDPGQPGDENAPLVNGTAEADSTINIYTDSSCTTLTASGAADGSGALSVVASVADDSSTTFYATAIDAAGNPSTCSTTFATYAGIRPRRRCS